MTPNDLVPHSRLIEILSARDAALEAVDRALSAMKQGFEFACVARSHATTAHRGDRYYEVDRSKSRDYSRIFEDVDVVASREQFRRELDASTWVHLIRSTGMEALMDQTAKDEFIRGLAGDVPPVTEDNIRATLEGLVADSHLIFGRGLARVFINLDRRFRSHDGFKIGSRIVLTHIFDQRGSLNYRVEEVIRDVERVFSVLDGERGAGAGHTIAAIRKDREGGGFNPRQSVTETPYFRCKAYKNGNLHLWFTRDDLVEKANQTLANYYGAVLPDAVSGAEDTLRERAATTAVSKDLAFYPTPPAVVQRLLARVGLDDTTHVLEPSAGEGAIVTAVLRHGSKCTAVEVDPGRAMKLKAMVNRNLTVHACNFLDMPPTPTYSHVIMNPPFYGRHWMSHVMHAWAFVRPGGFLLSVLPVTAELGASAEHEAFRSWANKNNALRHHSLFSDLPAESFAPSGTRIHTVMLMMAKSWSL